MCLECNDIGLIASAPEGETVYCEECVKGLTMAIRALDSQMIADFGWMLRKTRMGLDTQGAQGVLSAEYTERDRLSALLRQKQREADDPFALEMLL